ncbi:MAG: NAD(+) synthase [Candidatus Omnitrophica bacterium]|nr:NAD(+) synthase [Candidatus Omnitrophota bacterium]MBU1924986.1 NAD(+) synthase [Candidatus Omnitrophota bacterium]
MKSIEKKIILWLRRKVKEAGARGVVFGLSGGVDSAVVAVLVKKAVGTRHLALILPCHSHKSASVDAMKIIRKLKLNIKTVDLTKLFDYFTKILPKGNKLALANIKPRLRMIALYYFANSLNYLVAGTGNKSELRVGYFTKYGDGGVDILPIGNLLKRDVRKLAKKLGIPQTIIDKSPSADLWPGQTDEGEMGISYDELDSILAGGKTSNVSKGRIKKIKRMMEKSEHKRSLPEIFKVTSHK